ncbi:Isonitrile hydratase [Methyloligella halotolerans]|uniref:Isonitrile hydratase n=1 Tax=Methyloligella halotolerans TaxID=1177755 RepID=A0A1E2S0I2_9HYPH|nr:DJ-1/PfpI family protein [Methyloligella halotolerans]ODA68013.1 Isonitrile hydratase [Methyloligella halotolerans]
MALAIGFLLFPDVQQLDLTGPYEVFASLPGAELYLVAKDPSPVRTATGLVLQPTVSMSDSPQLDIVCVPGGRGVNALLTDEQTLAFLRGQADGARYVTSVCTGALVLGAAGLLEGKRATTHWNALDLLSDYGAEPVNARYVIDGNLATGGGVTAGIDFGLALAEEIAGRETAEAIQLQLEYAPAPPFDSGSPETASKPVVEKVKQQTAAIRSEREALAKEYAERR